jgi:integrase
MTHSWDEAASLWLVENQHKATIHQDKRKLAWLATYFSGLSLGEISRELIMVAAHDQARATSMPNANRYLALVRSILRRAWRVWEWIDRIPYVELFPESAGRVRWITADQARHLLDELPEHQRDMVLFALATGLRQANVLHLEWHQVDLRRSLAWIHADQAKGRRSFSVPLNETALSVLHKCRGRHRNRVFTYKGKPIAWANTLAWRKALVRAGIENFRWHDLRHTWASWHVQHGTPLYVLQDLGAWRSETMVRRYAHLAPSHYAEHAAVIDGVLT